jgi:hypothetical protein
MHLPKNLTRWAVVTLDKRGFWFFYLVWCVITASAIMTIAPAALLIEYFDFHRGYSTAFLLVWLVLIGCQLGIPVFI